MPQSLRNSSQDSTADAIRKRVCKACDRCRLKKSKCDGSTPCSRCKADNAICVFGERKKSHDKIYPKGYVEMLEQQQTQLVSGLQEMYKQLREANAWSGPALSESSGHPLTHDILAKLNLLGDLDSFEEDTQKIQSKLLAEGAGYIARRGSVSSESEHSQRNLSSGTPNEAKHPVFRDSFAFGGSNASSPASQSNRQQRPSFLPPSNNSPLQQSPQLPNDPQLYQPDWAMPDLAAYGRFSHQGPVNNQNVPTGFDQFAFGNNLSFDQGFDQSMAPFDAQNSAFANQMNAGYPDNMDVEFNQFVAGLA